ncbi:MAG: zinc ribbon domain-containing protein [Anaerolineae bacterium]|nr:zinc ribbon domain-containing protein [Anaerolineae bacterium]
MPIYEYYCPICHGRYNHLAKRIGEPAPPCPRCGCKDVERMVSAPNLIYGAQHHAQELRQSAGQVNGDNPQAIAQFLKTSGRLEDAEGLYGSKVYRELIERRIEGATDAELADLVPTLTTEMQASEVTQMAGAMLFSEQVENRMQAAGPPEEPEHQPHTQSKRAADNLGWA